MKSSITFYCSCYYICLCLCATVLLIHSHATHGQHYRCRHKELWSLPIDGLLHDLGELSQHDMISLRLDKLIAEAHPDAVRGLHEQLDTGRLNSASLTKTFVRATDVSVPDNEWYGYNHANKNSVDKSGTAGEILHLVRRPSFSKSGVKSIDNINNVHSDSNNIVNDSNAYATRYERATITGTLHSRIDGLTYVIYPDEEGTLQIIAKETHDYEIEKGGTKHGSQKLQKRLQNYSGTTINTPTNRYNTSSLEVLSSSSESLPLSSNIVVNRQRKLQNASAVQGNGEVVQVDGMIMWTKEAECALSNIPYESCTITTATEEAMRALIDQAASQLDIAMQQSGVLMRFRLVHAFRVDYIEDGDAVDALNAMASKVDGVMDDIHILRSKYKADYVAMIIARASTCGNSYLGYPTTNAGLLFSVIPYNCATERYSFAHEFGHVAGCDHDRGYLNACDSPNTNFGYKSRVEPIRDVMATWCDPTLCDHNPFANCDRVLRYSNVVNYTENGVNMGPIGDDLNNCAAQMRENRFIVANASENLGFIPSFATTGSSTVPPLVSASSITVPPANYTTIVSTSNPMSMSGEMVGATPAPIGATAASPAYNATTVVYTQSPTQEPTSTPTRNPTLSPTRTPTKSPTAFPTAFPTISPTAQPSWSPTKNPTMLPTVQTTIHTVDDLTNEPVGYRIPINTLQRDRMSNSDTPSDTPSDMPSDVPSTLLSDLPTIVSNSPNASVASSPSEISSKESVESAASATHIHIGSLLSAYCVFILLL